MRQIPHTGSSVCVCVCVFAHTFSQVLLQLLRLSAARHTVKFVKYDQSSKCADREDSSVSYAAAVVSRHA